MHGEGSPEKSKAMGAIVKNEEESKLKKFMELRELTHRNIERETKERTEKNPKPTEDEIMVGAFKEMLEPQVRNAVFELLRKGYSTESSGFGGEQGEIQQIDGYFEIDEEIGKKLKALGVVVSRGKETGISLSEKYSAFSFKPEKPDLDETKKMWDEIVAVLPDKKVSAGPSISGGSEEFRKAFAPDRQDIRTEMLKRRLSLEEISSELAGEIKEELWRRKKEEKDEVGLALVRQELSQIEDNTVVKDTPEINQSNQSNTEEVKIGNESYFVKYVSKEELSPFFGDASGRVASVREDLSPRVKKFVKSHELYHLRDKESNLGRGTW